MAGRLDPSTLDRLVREHLAAALRLAGRLTGSPESAEDVVQEALVRVARSWQSFRAEANFRTWLFSIVLNVWRDSAAPRPDAQPLPPEAEDRRSPGPLAEAQERELRATVAARVSALPPRQREVLVLVAYEGLTVRDVAGMLGITEQNVYATLHVARERLRSELREWLVERRDATRRP